MAAATVIAHATIFCVYVVFIISITIYIYYYRCYFALNL